MTKMTLTIKGICDFCRAGRKKKVTLVAKLVSDPDQHVCLACHLDPRIPTIAI